MKGEVEKKAQQPEDKKKRWSERAKDLLTTDNQLREIVTLINMLHSARKNTPELMTDRALALHHLKQSHISNETLDIQEIKG